MTLEQLVGQQNAGGAARRRPPFFRTKKVALLGATASLQFAPWHDPSWTLVGHPCCRPQCKREPDWYFDMHRPECFMTEGKRWNPRYYHWLRHLQTPIFMQEDASSKPTWKVPAEYRDEGDERVAISWTTEVSPWAKIAAAVRYPIESVLAEHRGYFTNHCAYMIAIAMMEGVTHLGLFGCQYAGPERGVQRGSLEYWHGRIEQYGGTVVIPPKWNTVLAYPKGLYGYESHDDKGKLLGDYQWLLPKKVEIPGEAAPLAAVNMTNAASRIKLVPPPSGEPIAWERSGHTVRDDGTLIAVGA